MRLATIWLGLGGLGLGFVIGFLVASSINRSEINQLRAEAESAKNASGNSSSSNGETLSDEEIRDKIAEADQEPTNATFQKNLGLALYRYGAIKSDPNLIADSIRLLERASKLSPGDNDVVVALGNAWFDIGYAKKDNAAFAKAREYYISSLSKTPQDASVRTDVGMTYFLQDPPDDLKATAEFKRALSSDPKNEKALEFIIQALARQGDIPSAKSYLQKLRDTHPNNSSLTQLSSHIENPTNNAK